MPLERMKGEEKQMPNLVGKEKKESKTSLLITNRRNRKDQGKNGGSKKKHTHTEVAAEIAYNPRLKFQQRGP